MLNLFRGAVRRYTTSGSQRAAKAEIEKSYFEFKKMQENIKKPDSQLVLLKRRTMDQMLYRITVALSLMGIGGMGKLYYELYKKSSK